MYKNLREVVNQYAGHPWFMENYSNIIFELNHLELHFLDDYLFNLYMDEVSIDENPNNSNIAYLIGITSKEPTARIKTVGGGFPDVDCDFEQSRRDDVFAYLANKYGEGFAHIGTFGFAKAKNIFKDVCRIQDVDFKDSNEWTKLFPDNSESIKVALEESKDLKKKYDAEPDFKEIVDYASKMEGCIKSVGGHPCFAYDSLLYTVDGPTKIGSLLGKTVNIFTSHGVKPATITCNGIKPICKLLYSTSKYANAKSFTLITADHLVWSEGQYRQARNSVGFQIPHLPIEMDLRDIFAGWIWNDGYFDSVDSKQYVYFTPIKDDEAFTLFSDFFDNQIKDKCYLVNPDIVEYILNTFGDGFKSKNKVKKSPVFTTYSSSIAWLSGMVSANSSIQNECIRLKLSSLPLINYIQTTFNNYGFQSSIVHEVGKNINFSNGLYLCNDSYRLEWGAAASSLLSKHIVIIQEYKKNKIKPTVFTSCIEDVFSDYVFDFSVHTDEIDAHNGIVDGLVVHNCGVILADTPITDYVALFESKGMHIAQVDGSTTETIGLVKYDILGLKTLDVINLSFNLVRQRHPDFTYTYPYDIPVDNTNTYDLLCTSNLLGCFQIEGDAIAAYTTRCRPRTIDDISAIISLYRPRATWYSRLFGVLCCSFQWIGSTSI